MKFKLFVIAVLYPIFCIAQNSNLSGGGFVGKLAMGGFEDTLVFKNRKIVLKKNISYGYGVAHTFTYKVKLSEGGMRTNLINKKSRNRKKRWSKPLSNGDLHNKKIKLELQSNGDLHYYPSYQKDSFLVLTPLR